MIDQRPQSKLPFGLVLVASYLLAIVGAVATSWGWIEGSMGLGVLLLLVWLALIIWAFSRFGKRATWALLGLVVANPLTIFLGAAQYACAVNLACL